MKIVFVASEVVPFAKTGGLADVCGALPLELEALGHELIIIMPHHKVVGDRAEFNDRASVWVIGKNIKVYFIENKSFFDRYQLYGDSGNDYADNLDRFTFFCREALDLLKELGREVDIIHCHDWQTGLIPVLLKDPLANDPFFVRTKVVFTIHNLAYQGLFPMNEYAKLGVDMKLFNDHQLEFYEKVNLMKAGIVFSDYVTTVSPQYAREVQTKEWGCGLDGVLDTRKGSLAGILNGLDYSLWDPEHDQYIDPPYSASDLLARKIHKEKLQGFFGLQPLSDIPVFGFVGRLCYQKGIDLIESAIEGLMQHPIQMVFLGVGEDKYQRLLKNLSKRYPHQFSALVKDDEDISHQIYAGADFFLMPSVYEPCGLAQMIALRYGAIPVVSAVGGLTDTVVDCSSTKKGNGFVFSSYSVSGLLEAVDRAAGAYYHKEKFFELIMYAMSCRFTWKESAKHYIEVYDACRSLA